MKVSIIIPIYNVSEYIEECLKSALNQTYQDLEIILVDDASPDDSMDKVGKILNESNRCGIVKIISHDENRGLSAARNSGVSNSSGEYVYFLDSDDYLPNYSISTLMEYTKDYPDIVCGNFELLPKDGINFPNTTLQDGTALKEDEIKNAFFNKQWQQAACNKLIKRSLFTYKGCWFKEGILHEDELWAFQVAYSAKLMVICSHNTYVYRVRSGSITQKKSDKNFDSLITVFLEIREMIEESHIPIDKNLFSHLMNLQIFFFKELIRNNYSKEEIKKRISKVKHIFRKYDKFNIKYPIRSNLQLLAYKIPVNLAYLYVKAII